MDQEEIRNQVIFQIVPAVILENAAARLDDEFHLVQPELTDTMSIDEDTNLAELLNSLSFIKLIIEIESSFDFEFDDDKLDMNLFAKLGNLLDNIYEKKGLRSVSSV